MRLDPTSLRIFVSVVEERTIAATAERQHMVASAVSKRLSDLESTLKTTLLTRSNKGIEPTAAGIVLLGLARNVLHGLDDIYSQMREYSNGTRGHVRVFANIAAITQFLPPEIGSFLKIYPLVQIHLEEKKNSMIITKAIAENEADIGIFTSLDHGHVLEEFPYHTDELILIAPRDHPLAQERSVSLEQTLDFDYVGLHTGSTRLQLVKAALALDRPLRMRILVSSYDALCLMVNTGLGIGVLPKHCAAPYLKTLGLTGITLNEPWTTRQLVLCVRSYAALPVTAKLLLDHFRGVCGAASSSGGCDAPS